MLFLYGCVIRYLLTRVYAIPLQKMIVAQKFTDNEILVRCQNDTPNALSPPAVVKKGLIDGRMITPLWPVSDETKAFKKYKGNQFQPVRTCLLELMLISVVFVQCYFEEEGQYKMGFLEKKIIELAHLELFDRTGCLVLKPVGEDLYLKSDGVDTKMRVHNVYIPNRGIHQYTDFEIEVSAIDFLTILSARARRGQSFA